jgi:hypothetical protein
MLQGRDFGPALSISLSPLPAPKSTLGGRLSGLKAQVPVRKESKGCKPEL